MEKANENTTQTKVSAESEGLEGAEMSIGNGSSFVDNRPEAVAQRQMQAAANSSPQVAQLRTVQAAANGAPIQRQEAEGGEQTTAEPVAATEDPYLADLSPEEWLLVRGYIMEGKANEKEFTTVAAYNAIIVTEAIFLHRYVANNYVLDPAGPPPTMCLAPEVVLRDPRVAQLRPKVLAHGPIMDWRKVESGDRMVYIMEQLINDFGFPINGAAGLVGNLYAESGCLPSRVEGSREATPMRARGGSDGQQHDYTPEEIMNRERGVSGPRLPGVGLAQWTSANRRSGLFEHEYDGEVLGADILFSMDAQIDYLVNEMQSNYAGVYGVVTGADVTVNDATDDVVYRFEVPGSVLGQNAEGRTIKLPRTHENVQAVFAERRRFSNRALTAYQAAHPVDPAQPVVGPR